MTLKPAPKEFNELIDIDYIQYQNRREELMRIIVDLTKIEGITLKKTETGSLNVLYRDKPLLTIIPLRTDFRISINNIIQSLGREQILQKAQEIITSLKVVKILEQEGIVSTKN